MRLVSAARCDLLQKSILERVVALVTRVLEHARSRALELRLATPCTRVVGGMSRVSGVCTICRKSPAGTRLTGGAALGALRQRSEPGRCSGPSNAVSTLARTSAAIFLKRTLPGIKPSAGSTMIEPRNSPRIGSTLRSSKYSAGSAGRLKSSFFVAIFPSIATTEQKTGTVPDYRRAGNGDSPQLLWRFRGL
jgi:hypothetical protein